MLSAPPLVRPLSFGELLDQAFRLYRRYFFVLVRLINATGDRTTEVVAGAPEAGQEKLFTPRESGYFVLVGLVYAGLMAPLILFAPALGLLAH